MLHVHTQTFNFDADSFKDRFRGRMPVPTAFTLIELLVVIVIIASQGLGEMIPRNRLLSWLLNLFRKWPALEGCDHGQINELNVSLSPPKQEDASFWLD